MSTEAIIKSMRSNEAAGQPSSFTFTPNFIPQGDGSFLITPGKPVQRVTVANAAKELGCSVATIYRLIEAGFLKAERVSPHKTLVTVESLQAHRQNVRDPEYWDRRSLKP